MLERQPSRTALSVATHRAVHQLLEGGRVFRDPLAVRILATTPEALFRSPWVEPDRASMRAFVAVRAAFAEEVLAAAVRIHHASQLVVLGAGLDTFAYRSPYGPALDVFEVDHPATQAWKGRRLSETGILPPPYLTFVPVDFEADTLGERLASTGFDPKARTVVSWLGVVPYLTIQAIRAALQWMSDLPGGVDVVFDYSEPPERLPDRAREAQLARAGRVAGYGEPFVSHFDPLELHALLADVGLAVIDDLASADMRRPVAGARASRGGGHLLHAATPESV
jgi:methyltransferase (TIGR00027 family)